MAEIKTGTCHCGAIEFQVELLDGLGSLCRCDCSICRRKGTVMADVPIDKLVVTKGVDKLSLYQWNTKIAKHWFCSVCGIYTHHQRRSKPDEFGFNVACLEDTNPFELGDIPVANGTTMSVVDDT